MLTRNWKYVCIFSNPRFNLQILTHKLSHCCLLFHFLLCKWKISTTIVFVAFRKIKSHFPIFFSLFLPWEMIFSTFSTLSPLPNHIQYLFFHEFELSLSYAFRSRAKLMALHFCAIERKRIWTVYMMGFGILPISMGNVLLIYSPFFIFDAHWKRVSRCR